MRNFDWGFRATHILGGIIEALIILVCVAVLVGLVFLLVRFLLVGTRAAQLYVSRHDTDRVPPAAPPAAQTTVTDATKPQPAAPAKKTPRPKTRPSA